MLSLELLEELCKSNDQVRSDITKGLQYIYSGVDKYNKLVSEDVMGNIDAKQLKEMLTQVQVQLVDGLMQDIALDDLVLEDLNKLNPAQITIQEKTYDVFDWADVLASLCEYLAIHEREKFMSYINEEYINRNSVVFTAEQMLCATKIASTNIYLNLSLSNNKVRAVMANLFSVFQLDSNRLSIKVLK